MKEKKISGRKKTDQEDNDQQEKEATSQDIQEDQAEENRLQELQENHQETFHDILLDRMFRSDEINWETPDIRITRDLPLSSPSSDMSSCSSSVAGSSSWWRSGASQQL